MPDRRTSFLAWFLAVALLLVGGFGLGLGVIWGIAEEAARYERSLQ